MSRTLQLCLVLFTASSLACVDDPLQPVEDAGSRPPDAGETLPDAGEETPDAGEETPDAGEEAPDAGEETPDAGEEPEIPVLRFMVIGDQGTGSREQYNVGSAMAERCAIDGCDFAVLLGDNIYQSGVSGVDDPQWQEKFELPYAHAALEMPFYAVLGNHDYGGTIPLIGGDYGGLGNEWTKGLNEVRYTDHSTKWTMPSSHYTMKHQNVCFMMLDTNSILWDNTTNGNQWTWYAPALAAMQPCEWIFVASHHPYMSNGKHGNAGTYEAPVQLPPNWNPTLPYVSGVDVKRFFDDVVCGTADVLMAGHDHNRQWLAEKHCGAELIVSGAGAKTTQDENRGNATHFEEFEKPGFLYVVIEGKRMTGRFYDSSGAFEFERVVEKF